MANLFYTFQLIQSAGVIFINFCQYYKYKGSWLRNQFMPYIHLCLIVTLFFLIPIAAVVIYIITDINHKIWGLQIGVWMLTYALISCFVAIWFYFAVVPMIVELKNQYYWNIELDRKEEKYLNRNNLKLTTNETLTTLKT